MDIKLKQLGKRYRYEWIFRNLDYHFEANTTYAILGPNGSGKSTLMKVLSGYASPSKGTISFWAEQPLPIDKVYQQLGYAAPYIELIEELTLNEVLNFHRRFKTFQNDLQPADLIELLGFSKSQQDKAVKYFSSGMKQRLKLLLAICTDTPLLLLDEPTTNLDAQGVAWYRQLIQQFAQDRLVIVASNIEHDYDFCTHSINILDYKKRQKD
jgi:ABC-type multidrug transport system ATPase subunit